MTTSSTKPQTFETYNSLTRIDLAGAVEQDTVNFSRKHFTSLFGQPAQDAMGDDLWMIRFDNGTVAGIRRKGLGWSVAGLATDTQKQALTQVQIALDLHREAAELRRAEKQASMYRKIDEGLISVDEIMQSITVGRGKNYAMLVELTMLVQRQSDATHQLIRIASEAALLPKEVADFFKHADADMGGKIICLASQIGKIINTEQEADELLNWATRIAAIEQRAVQGLVDDLAKTGGKT